MILYYNGDVNVLWIVVISKLFVLGFLHLKARANINKFFKKCALKEAKALEVKSLAPVTGGVESLVLIVKLKSYKRE